MASFLILKRFALVASIFAGVCVTSVGALAAKPVQPAPAALHLKGGKWFDGQAFTPMEWYAVQGKLTRKRPARVDVSVNLAGAHVIPPLAEAHNHDIQNGVFGAHAAARYLDRGIFYTMIMCAMPNEVAPFKEFVNRPNTVDVNFVGGCISSSDGHPLRMAIDGGGPDGQPLKPEAVYDRLYYPIDSEQELERKWPMITASKPAALKLMLIHSEDYAARKTDQKFYGKNGLDPAIVAPIIARAHGAGIRVVVHAESAADAAVAVKAGADMIAHLPGYKIAKGKTGSDYRISDEVLKEAKAKGVVFITTAGVAEMIAEKGSAALAAVREVQVDNLKRLRGHGVAMAIGSDNPMGSVVDEMEYLDGLGVIPRPELLRLATRDSAHMVFPRRAIGTFEEGAEASLIALEGNPLTDLGALRRVRLGIKQGNLLLPRSASAGK